MLVHDISPIGRRVGDNFWTRSRQMGADSSAPTALTAQCFWTRLSNARPMRVQERAVGWWEPVVMFAASDSPAVLRCPVGRPSRISSQSHVRDRGTNHQLHAVHKTDQLYGLFNLGLAVSTLCSRLCDWDKSFSARPKTSKPSKDKGKGPCGLMATHVLIMAKLLPFSLSVPLEGSSFSGIWVRHGVPDRHYPRMCLSPFCS